MNESNRRSILRVLNESVATPTYTGVKAYQVELLRYWKEMNDNLEKELENKMSMENEFGVPARWYNDTSDRGGPMTYSGPTVCCACKHSHGYACRFNPQEVSKTATDTCSQFKPSDKALGVLVPGEMLTVQRDAHEALEAEHNAKADALWQKHLAQRHEYIIKQLTEKENATE